MSAEFCGGAIHTYILHDRSGVRLYVSGQFWSPVQQHNEYLQDQCEDTEKFRRDLCNRGGDCDGKRWVTVYPHRLFPVPLDSWVSKLWVQAPACTPFLLSPRLQG